MKVKVKAPYQVRHEGKTYTDGDTVDAPTATARRWVTAGWAEETGSKSSSSSEGKAKQSSSNKAQSKSDNK